MARFGLETSSERPSEVLLCFWTESEHTGLNNWVNSLSHWDADVSSDVTSSGHRSGCDGSGGLDPTRLVQLGQPFYGFRLWVLPFTQIPCSSPSSSTRARVTSHDDNQPRRWWSGDPTMNQRQAMAIRGGRGKSGGVEVWGSSDGSLEEAVRLWERRRTLMTTTLDLGAPTSLISLLPVDLLGLNYWRQWRRTRMAAEDSRGFNRSIAGVAGCLTSTGKSRWGLGLR